MDRFYPYDPTSFDPAGKSNPYGARIMKSVRNAGLSLTSYALHSILTSTPIYAEAIPDTRAAVEHALTPSDLIEVG